jgi:anti-sigma regulatory factor (Ser/Thr protein kinase)
MGRRHIRVILLESGVSLAVVDDVETVVCELLGNSVQHAQPLSGAVLAMSWQITDSLVRVQVTDGGSRRNIEPANRPKLSESGRGLRIVDRLVDDWGVIDDVDSRSVWGRFRWKKVS